MPVIIENRNVKSVFLDCSSNPDYPAAVMNTKINVTVAGKIGGASGIDVTPGDTVICHTSNAGGSQAAVGSYFYIVQANMDAATVTEVNAATNPAKFITPLTLDGWTKRNLGLNIVTNTGSIQYGEDLTASGQYALNIGSVNTVGFAGIFTGFNGVLSNNYNIGYGIEVAISGNEAQGYGTYITSSGYRSNANGHFLTASNTLSFVWGAGYSNANRLVNNIAGAMFFGTNSTIPSLVVLGGSGVGTVNNVGINITDPAARLDILGGDDSKAPFRIRKSSADKAGASALEGEFQLTTGNVLQFAPTAGAWRNFSFTDNPVFTGVISVPAGSSGSPSYTFTGNTNTGFYLFGTNVVGVSTNGVVRMTWGSSSVCTMYGNLNPDGNLTRNLGNTGAAWAFGFINNTGSSIYRVLDFDGVNYKEALSSSTATNVLDINKGYKTLDIYSANSSNRIARFLGIASAVNYWEFRNNITGKRVEAYARGGDSNVSFRFVPLGTGSFQILGTTGSASTDSFLQVTNTPTSAGDSTISHYNVVTNGSLSARSVIRFLQNNSSNAAAINSYIWGGSSNITAGSETSTFGIDTVASGSGNRATRFLIDGLAITMAHYTNGFVQMGSGATTSALLNLKATQTDVIIFEGNNSSEARYQFRNIATTPNVTNTVAFYYYVKNSAGSTTAAVKTLSKFSTNTASSEVSSYEIVGFAAGTSATRFKIDGSIVTVPSGGTFQAPIYQGLDFDGVTWRNALTSPASDELKLGGGFTKVSIGGLSFTGTGQVTCTVNGFTFNGSVASTIGVTFAHAFSGSTAGDIYHQRITGSFTKSSINANYFSINATPTINQSGTSVGDIVIFNADPNITSIVSGNKLIGYRSDIEDGADRYNFYGIGTAPNYFGGNVYVSNSKAIYLGDEDTDGSYKFIISGDDLLIQQREAGVWNTKSTISGA